MKPTHSVIRYNLLFMLLALIACLASLLMLMQADWGARRNMLVDGTCFYCAGQIASNDSASPYSHADMQQCMAQYDKAFVPFIYPPPSLALFSALALLPYEAGVWSLVLTSVFALGLLYVGLNSLYGFSALPRAQLIAVMGFMALTQVGFYNLPYAQINIIAAAFVAAFASLNINRRAVLSGLCLGMAILLKSHFLLLMVIPLMRREWRVLLTASGVVLFAAVAITLLAGPAVWAAWADATWSGYAYGNLGQFVQNQAAAASGFSLPALAEARAPQLLPILRVLAVAGFALCMWWLYKRQDRLAREVYPVALALLAGWLYLFSPVTWPAHYVFILPLAATLLMQQQRPSNLIAAALVLLHEVYVYYAPLGTWPLTLSVVMAMAVVIRFEHARKTKLI